MIKISEKELEPLPKEDVCPFCGAKLVLEDSVCSYCKTNKEEIKKIRKMKEILELEKNEEMKQIEENEKMMEVLIKEEQKLFIQKDDSTQELEEKKEESAVIQSQKELEIKEEKKEIAKKPVKEISTFAQKRIIKKQKKERRGKLREALDDNLENRRHTRDLLYKKGNNSKSLNNEMIELTVAFLKKTGRDVPDDFSSFDLMLKTFSEEQDEERADLKEAFRLKQTVKEQKEKLNKLRQEWKTLYEDLKYI